MQSVGPIKGLSLWPNGPTAGNELTVTILKEKRKKGRRRRRRRELNENPRLWLPSGQLSPAEFVVWRLRAEYSIDTHPSDYFYPAHSADREVSDLKTRGISSENPRAIPSSFKTAKFLSRKATTFHHSTKIHTNQIICQSVHALKIICRSKASTTIHSTLLVSVPNFAFVPNYRHFSCY